MALPRFQDMLGGEPTKEVLQSSNAAGPASLMTGPKPGAIVTVEVFVKENQVAPVRIVLELIQLRLRTQESAAAL